MFDDHPDVVRCEIVFEDGSKRLATGEEAQKWTEWLDGGAGLRVAHGEEAPDIDFDEEPDWVKTRE